MYKPSNFALICLVTVLGVAGVTAFAFYEYQPSLSLQNLDNNIGKIGLETSESSPNIKHTADTTEASSTILPSEPPIANNENEPGEVVQSAITQTDSGQAQSQTIATPPQVKPQPQQINPVQVTTSTDPQPETQKCTGAFGQQLLCLINEYRVSKGLGKLTSNAGLASVALEHSIWMNQTGIFSHTGINGSKFSERCATAGITCLAENLAFNTNSATTVLSMWQANAGHNQNLLGPYTNVGIGISDKYLTLLLN